MTDVKLGFCSPVPTYLYVGSGDGYLWYKFDINTEKQIGVSDCGLSCFLSEIRLTSKEFKGKENIKLDIAVGADEAYVIRSGIETNFTKSFLLSIAQVKDFTKPIIISVAPGKDDDKVVFCHVYDAKTKQRYKYDWNINADWAQIIADTQSRLGQRTQETFNPSSVERESLNLEIEKIMSVKEIDIGTARELLSHEFGVRSRSFLTDEQLVQFKNMLASA